MNDHGTMLIPAGLRRKVEQAFPDAYGFLRGVKCLARSAIWNWPFQTRVRRLLYGHEPIRCAGGPFKGLLSENLPTWANLTPKWVGTYELEVQPFVQRLLEWAPSVVVDIGCAEGFYVAGIARALPGVRVLARDTDRFAQFLTARLTRINGVSDRVEIGGFMSLSKWRPPEGRVALIVDIEGFEYELFRDCNATALSGCLMLVEVHQRLLKDLDIEELGGYLAEKFGDTHTVERVDKCERTAADLPLAVRERLPEDLWLKVSDEQRAQHTVWLFFVPKAHRER